MSTDIFKEYIAMFQNYVNFNDRTNLRGYWMAVLWNVVASALVALLGKLFNTTALAALYSLAVIVPGVAITVRRLRDSGKEWTYMLFGLIPLVGWFMLVVQLTKPSIADDGVPTV